MSAVVHRTAELPCDLRPEDPEDQVRLVLWYRGDTGTPIYRLPSFFIYHPSMDRALIQFHYIGSIIWTLATVSS